MIGFRFAVPALLGAMLMGAAPDPVAEVRALENRVNAAYAANDLPTYFSFYADDLRALFATGPTTLAAYKADWTAFIKSGGGIESFKDSDMQIKVSPAGDAAVASYLATVTTRVPGKAATTSSFSETDVWFKRAGKWQIVEVHYSENPPPAR